MFFELAKSLKVKNNIICKINFALIKLNSSLFKFLTESPELTNNSFEPLDNTQKIIIYKYPYIDIELLPYRTTIQYDEIIKLSNNNYTPENISRIVITLIINNINKDLN